MMEQAQLLGPAEATNRWAIYNGGGANGCCEAAKDVVWIADFGEINAESSNTSRLYC